MESIVSSGQIISTCSRIAHLKVLLPSLALIQNKRNTKAAPTRSHPYPLVLISQKLFLLSTNAPKLSVRNKRYCVLSYTSSSLIHSFLSRKLAGQVISTQHIFRLLKCWPHSDVNKIYFDFSDCYKNKFHNSLRPAFLQHAYLFDSKNAT